LCCISAPFTIKLFTEIHGQVGKNISGQAPHKTVHKTLPSYALRIA
jgi:hypothetical protein